MFRQSLLCSQASCAGRHVATIQLLGDEVRKYLAKSDMDRSRLMERLVSAKKLADEHPINLHIKELRSDLLAHLGQDACQRGLFANQASPLINRSSLCSVVQPLHTHQRSKVGKSSQSGSLDMVKTQGIMLDTLSSRHGLPVLCYADAHACARLSELKAQQALNAQGIKLASVCVL